MAIRVYDSMARELVPLETRDDGRVGIYACGPTVYSYIHIGNARTLVWFDVIRRYLNYRGYDVTYVMNYTDVDDKIIERARLERLPADGIAAKYERAFEHDMAALGARPPDVIPRATQHVDHMIEAIEGLIDKGVAYEVAGDVWFSVETFPGYGKLSGRSLEEMRAGERVEPHESKRHPLDFALWKSAKEGEPSWESPWGPGRPGWHIECSVMSTRYLGMGFDIHGGGSDLMFPHHENEIAQAEALHGTGPFARRWLHAGMVQMESEKMSKSLGNVVLARDVVRTYAPEAVRYWMLTGSYRSQVVFSDESLNDATQAYERWRTFLESARHLLGADMPPRAPSEGSNQRAQPPAGAGAEQHVERFVEAMDDDFNSAQALAEIHELVRRGNIALNDAQSDDDAQRSALRDLVAGFIEITDVLGFTFSAGEASSELVAGLLDYLLELRETARAEKAFERADAIRERITALGVVIEDTPAGPRWRLSAATDLH